MVPSKKLEIVTNDERVRTDVRKHKVHGLRQGCARVARLAKTAAVPSRSVETGVPPAQLNGADGG